MEGQWESVTTMSPLACPQMLLHSGCCLLRGDSVPRSSIPRVRGSLWADCQKQPGSDCPWPVPVLGSLLDTARAPEARLWALRRTESRIWAGDSERTGWDSSVQMAACAAQPGYRLGGRGWGERGGPYLRTDEWWS